MREIKFKAWDKKKMLNRFEITQDGCIGYTDMFETYHPLTEAVLIQYTGFKDKNGKEIYECDIVEIPDDYDKYGFFAGEIREVYFAFGAFRLKPIRNENAIGNYLEDNLELEVIGNIFENPELLNG